MHDWSLLYNVFSYFLLNAKATYSGLNLLSSFHIRLYDRFWYQDQHHDQYLSIISSGFLKQTISWIKVFRHMMDFSQLSALKVNKPIDEVSHSLIVAKKCQKTVEKTHYLNR